MNAIALITYVPIMAVKSPRRRLDCFDIESGADGSEEGGIIDSCFAAHSRSYIIRGDN